MPDHPDHTGAMVTTPQYAIAQHQGHRRRLHCDTAAVHVAATTTSLVVTDGVGDHYDAQYAAEVAAPTAAVAAAASGSASVGLHAARGALADLYPEGCPPDQRGDCVIVVVAWRPATLTVAWAGDARAWRLGAAGLVQLTSDHTKAAELEAAGHPAELVRSLRHIVTATATSGEIGYHQVDLTELPRQRLLLASDGLHGYVAARDVGCILETEELPQDAADALVQAALATGGHDNIAVIVADLPRHLKVPPSDDSGR